MAIPDIEGVDTIKAFAVVFLGAVLAGLLLKFLEFAIRPVEQVIQGGGLRS